MSQCHFKPNQISCWQLSCGLTHHVISAEMYFLLKATLFAKAVLTSSFFQLALEERSTNKILSLSFYPEENCMCTHAHRQRHTHADPMRLFFPTSLLIKLGKYRSSCELRLRRVRGQEVRSSVDSQQVHPTSATRRLSPTVVLWRCLCFKGFKLFESDACFFDSDNTLQKYGK